MRFTGNGITNCYPDQVEDFISITVPTIPTNGFWPGTSARSFSLRGAHEHILRIPSPPNTRTRLTLPPRSTASRPTSTPPHSIAHCPRHAPDCRTSTFGPPFRPSVGLTLLRLYTTPSILKEPRRQEIFQVRIHPAAKALRNEVLVPYDLHPPRSPSVQSRYYTPFARSRPAECCPLNLPFATDGPKRIYVPRTNHNRYRPVAPCKINIPRLHCGACGRLSHHLRQHVIMQNQFESAARCPRQIIYRAQESIRRIRRSDN